MKTKYLLLTATLIFIVFLIGCQEDSDLEQPFNPDLALEDFDYFEEAIPYESTAYSEASNHDKIAGLGRILFYDSRLSQNNSIACASCHHQEIGFSDNTKFSSGLHNFETSRNTMTLVNNAYQISHFWEGQRGKIEDHILSPISNHTEMGMKDIEALVEKLSEIEAYNKLFNEVFDEPINEELIAISLSTFVASIISYNSKFDQGNENNFANFTNTEKRGKDLFFGKAKCSSCHGGDHYAAEWRGNANIGLDKEYEDQGAENGKFKVPSLRNISLTAPYMHDGRFETLEEVVNHYVHGIQDHPDLDWELQEPISLTDLEKSELVEFLHTLTDYELVSDEKFSDPFR